ncbi:hypothetical protein [Microbacterium sp.]|uniref:hypothetical protein n=1 Tax=Microbacterium sp. TaxID=51671 RepID=UPI00334252CB
MSGLMAARWMALVNEAILRGEEVETVPVSPFLAATTEELLERLEANGRFTWCQHMGGVGTGATTPDIVAWPGHAYGTCVPCALDFRAEIEAARRRTCERCDSARATAVHQADLGVVPGFAFVALAILLCEECAEEEGLRPDGLPVGIDDGRDGS